MTPEQLLKLRRQYEQEIEDAKAKLKALDDISKFVKETPNPHKSKKLKKNKSEFAYDPSRDVNKTELMRTSLVHLGQEFKTKNFMSYLRKTYPKVTFTDTFVSNALAKFIKKEKIVEVVNAGERKKGYVYRRKTG